MNEQRVIKLKKFLEDDPGDSFSRFALALECLKDNDVQTAKTHFEFIRDNDPGYIGVYYHLGMLYYHSGDHTKARETFTTGVTLAREAGEMHAASELEQALNELETDQN